MLKDVYFWFSIRFALTSSVKQMDTPTFKWKEHWSSTEADGTVHKSKNQRNTDIMMLYLPTIGFVSLKFIFLFIFYISNLYPCAWQAYYIGFLKPFFLDSQLTFGLLLHNNASIVVLFSTNALT